MNLLRIAARVANPSTPPVAGSGGNMTQPMDSLDCGLSFPKGMTAEQAIETIRGELQGETGEVYIQDQYEDQDGWHAVLLWDLPHDLMWGKSDFRAEKDGVVLEIEMP